MLKELEMGLDVNIYRDVTSNTTSTIKGYCLTNVEGPCDPCEDYPAAKLENHVRGAVRIVPEKLENKWTMMGGNYAGTCDSRFSRKIASLLGHDFYGAVAIHDRVED
jgi:hypothetical protein